MPDYDPKSIPILDDVIETDIIEQADAEDKHKAPIADITDMEDELSADDSTINLFSTAPVELSPEDAIIEDSTVDNTNIDDLDAGDSGPSIGTIDSLDDGVDDTGPVDTNDGENHSYHASAYSEDSEPRDFEEEPYESALIDYHSDADALHERSDQASAETRPFEDDAQAETEEVDNSIVAQPASPAETHASQAAEETLTIALDDIVDDVVNDIISQLMPDLELRLRGLVQQALEDRLPEKAIRQHRADSEN